jgi:hypothetical protein
MRGGFYSMVVDSPGVLGFSEYRLVLDEGVNVLNLVVGDLDEFQRRLTGQGVVIRQVNQLDGVPESQGKNLPALPGPLV